MSNELSIATERGQTLEHLMGVATAAPSNSNGPTLARLSQVQTALKAEVEMGGKKMRMDVIPVGHFCLKVSEDVSVYSETVSIRVFLQREQWTRWNSEHNIMEKSVLSQNVKGDLQDSLGGFNLGRPAGYIADWEGLPESMKEIVRSVKRTRVIMGSITIGTALDSNGEPSKETYTDVPFIYDVKNNTSIKNLDKSLKSLSRQGTLPIMSELTLKGLTDTLPNGSDYGFLDTELGSKVELLDSDNTTLSNFLEVVEYTNGKILDKYNEFSDKGLSKEDADLVGSIVDVEAV